MTVTDANHLDQLSERFIEKFGRSDEAIHIFFAPGRVNLIGEYTDFTGGLVFPCGINQGTLLLIRETHNSEYRFASTNFDLMAQLKQHEISRTHGDSWINYPLGVLDQYVKKGVKINGFDCLYSGNVPNGAGLSSSASIEVVTTFALNTLLDTGYSLLELVHMAQAAENNFVGMQCGIMDQFAVTMAKADHAIQLHCGTLEYRHVPMDLTDLSIMISNTNQRRELNDSAYNERVAQCRTALDILIPLTGIEALGQLTPEQLSEHESAFLDQPVALQRARHICEENARVRAAVPALEAGNFRAFGQLMNASHDSLRDLFEVSSEPLNQLVDLARAHNHVLGSRLTGAGFGGCTVTLLSTDAIESFKHAVGTAYTQATGLTADFHIVRAGDGVRNVLPESS